MERESPVVDEIVNTVHAENDIELSDEQVQIEDLHSTEIHDSQLKVESPFLVKMKLHSSIPNQIPTNPYLLKMTPWIPPSLSSSCRTV